MTPFYDKAREMWQETQNEQILKGLKKYPEPFNPHSWTPKELLKHAMQENVDQAHYLVGLYEQLEDQEKEIRRLKAEIYALKNPANSVPQKSPFEIEEMRRGWDGSGRLPFNKPPYADLDD